MGLGAREFWHSRRGLLAPLTPRHSRRRFWRQSLVFGYYRFAVAAAALSNVRPLCYWLEIQYHAKCYSRSPQVAASRLRAKLSPSAVLSVCYAALVAALDMRAGSRDFRYVRLTQNASSRCLSGMAAFGLTPGGVRVCSLDPCATLSSV